MAAEVAEEVAEVAEVEVEEEAAVFLPDHPHSRESWEATHQKNSTETERKVKLSYSTSSSIEE